MRVFALLAGLCAASCAAGSPGGPTGEEGAPIIDGTLDAHDPAVLELFYVTTFPVAVCNGNQTCLQSCGTTTNGDACTSGADCVCGSADTCSGELIGPRTVVTAGHCTDLTAGGEISGAGGPALTLCQSVADAQAVVDGEATSDGCNLAAFVLFNNTCTTTDQDESCEAGLVEAGNYILGVDAVNPGYDGNVYPPYTATNNDNDIGLVHLAATTLQNGGAEPPLLTFNRRALGAACTDLGSLRFVGYGITDPSQGSAALSGIKYSVQHDVKVKDTWHDEEDGPTASSLSTCGASTGDEPTCSGDSGGPSFDSEGVIVGITSLGDPSCVSYGEDVRIDAYQDWIDTTMTAWGNPLNGAPGGDAGEGTGGSSAGESGQSGSCSTSPVHDGAWGGVAWAFALATGARLRRRKGQEACTRQGAWRRHAMAHTTAYPP